MKIEIKTKNMQLTAALSDYTEKRLTKLDKYFNKDVTCIVTLIVEKDTHKAEATMLLDHYMLRAESAERDMYVAIDNLEEKLDRQIHKYKTKLNRKGKTSSILETTAIQDDATVEPDEITKRKEFVVKPMNEQEAILQMEMLGHDFFAFLNEETNSISIVYKRKNGGYGLLIPSLS